MLITETGTGEISQITSTSTTATVTNLKAFTNYSVHISAYTVSYGPFSSTVHIRTLQDG